MNTAVTMKPTEILSAEHRVIKQVLDCLEVMVGRAEQTGQVEKPAVQDAVAFFRTFADQCHHGKEETHLFPAMEAKGFPRQGGPTGVMLHEHEIGRRCVRGMAEAAATGNAASFIEHGRAYLELLRQHIQKEDHCLFRMADQAFSEADQEALLAAFERVEHDHMGAGTHEKFLTLANDLADQFGVARAHTNAEHKHCCCGH